MAMNQDSRKEQAARAALEEYCRPGFYERLAAVGDHFYTGFQEIIDRSGLPVRGQRTRTNARTRKGPRKAIRK